MEYITYERPAKVFQLFDDEFASYGYGFPNLLQVLTFAYAKEPENILFMVIGFH